MLQLHAAFCKMTCAQPQIFSFLRGDILVGLHGSLSEKLDKTPEKCKRVQECKLKASVISHRFSPIGFKLSS